MPASASAKAIAVRPHWRPWRSTTAGPSAWSKCAISPARIGSGPLCSGSSGRGKARFPARVKGPYEALALAPVPAIAHVKTGTALGISSSAPGAEKIVVVADPGRGIEKLTREEFCRRWTGTFCWRAGAKAALPQKRRPVAPWRRSSACSGPIRPSWWKPSSATCSMTLLGVATSYFIQHLVDSCWRQRRLLKALGVGMSDRPVPLPVRHLRRYLAAHVSRKVDLILVAGYARHSSPPHAFFETRRVGEILSRVHDAAKVREAVSGTTLTAVVDGTLVVLMLVVLWLYDLPLAMVATAFIPLLVPPGPPSRPPGGCRRRWKGRPAPRSPGRGRLRRRDREGLRRRRRAEEAEPTCRLRPAVFSLQKLGISIQTPGMLRDDAGRHRRPVVRRTPRHGRALTIGQLMFFYTLLGICWDRWSVWPR